VWYARRSDDAGTSSHRHEATHDDEAIEADEEDHREDATEASTGTSVPLPTATDATRASVEQLSSLAVSSKDDAAAATELPTEVTRSDKEVEAESNVRGKTEASAPTS
jgi:hypothetical protein